ncbi:MAG: hypothetical protein GX950_03135 [Candidatus Diapherotrites archaeon]|uniref:Uncharacterized protein n=1 Tax=Candidatus Iainarchaeum sp. TaxID=3101447 RepID=A0A7K4BZR7_9ARCH|nr:hypothetical protein [Candidatus Diapherotrites archaeon]
MDDKIAFVVDSIKKLLILKVSDEEIIVELGGVGISKEDSMELIKKAKESLAEEANNGQKPVEEEKKSSAIYNEVSSKLSMDEQVVNQLNITNEEKSKGSQTTPQTSSAPNVKSIFEDELKEKTNVDDYQPIKNEDDDTGSDKEVGVLDSGEVDEEIEDSVDPNASDEIEEITDVDQVGSTHTDVNSANTNSSSDVSSVNSSDVSSVNSSDVSSDNSSNTRVGAVSVSDNVIDVQKDVQKDVKVVSDDSSANSSDNVSDDSSVGDSNSELIDEIQSKFIKNKFVEKENLVSENKVPISSTKKETPQPLQTPTSSQTTSSSNLSSSTSSIHISPSTSHSASSSSSTSSISSSTSKLDESLRNLSQKTRSMDLTSSPSNYSSFQKREGVSQSVSSEMDSLWRKGIVVAVNAKFNEMKKLKEEVDSNISEKVDASVKKEVAQLRVLLDSQKELLIASNRAALEDKQKEISFIIDSKIAELKQSNKQLSENLAALELAKSEQKAYLEQIKQMLEEARRTKAQLLVEMNSELIKSKSQAQAFLDNAGKQLKDLDERVNRTLELQKNIADGMIEQAERKIETLTLQKTDDLVDDLEIRLNKLKVIETEINPDLLVQKVKVLDDFKKQFIETMKDNITQINVAIEEINKKNVDLDQLITQKMLTIDAKIEELTKFEKNFTELINNLTEKM